MLPITQLADYLMSDTLQGANGTDPVRKPRVRKRRFTRRGTS
jgi:hypothetical protein